MKKYTIYVAMNGHTIYALHNFRAYLLTHYQGFTEYSTTGYYQSINENCIDVTNFVESTIVFEILTKDAGVNFKYHIKQMFEGLGEESILYSVQNIDELEFITL